MEPERTAALYARLDATARGEATNLLAEMRTGFAVLGDSQHLPGYCVLLYRHRVEHLDDLPDAERIAFLRDLSLLGEAVRVAASAHDPAFRRINYEVLGNSWTHLHGHVHARYDWEPDEYRGDPVWCYPDRCDPAHRLDDRHEPLRAAIAQALDEATRRVYARD
jgi:diadenosine tetraphosphate (Ap4A) HIT family hydrolase